MKFDHRIFCKEADNVTLSNTPCYVRLTRHCHETSRVLADPFTNMLVFFYARCFDSSQPIPQSNAKRNT